MRSKKLMVVVAAMIVIMSGCQWVSVGAKCKPSQGAARNATHVLFCQKGRWRQTVTIGQAADIIMSTWPGSASVSIGGTYGNTSWYQFVVTTRGGKPAANTNIRVEAPGLFASTSTLNLTTDASGMVSSMAGPVLGTPGTYTVKVYGVGSEPFATTTVTLQGGIASSIKKISGDEQQVAHDQPYAPFVFQVVDENGFGARPGDVEVSMNWSGLTMAPIMTAEGNSVYSIDASEDRAIGTATVSLKIQARYGSMTMPMTATRTAAE